MQGVLQRLASLRKGRAGDDRQRLPVREAVARGFTGPEPDHGRIHPGAGPECVRLDAQERLGRAITLQHDRQAAILTAARAGRDTLGDLFLQHEDHLIGHLNKIQQMKQQGRADVIGQIADDPQAATPQAAKIKMQRVTRMHQEIARGFEFGPQAGAQAPVDLDHIQAPRRLQQGPGQRAPAGADFNDVVVPRGPDKVDDPPDHRRVMQEVLSEPLFGAVFSGIHQGRGWPPGLKNAAVALSLRRRSQAPRSDCRNPPCPCPPAPGPRHGPPKS